MRGSSLSCPPTRSQPDATGTNYVLGFDDGRELTGDRLLVATGRRPRVRGIGLETVGVEPDTHGVPVDARLCAAEGLWAIGDVNGLWPLTHVGKYQGDVVASNILGKPRKANYEAVPRVVYTDPQAAAVGASAGRFSAMVPLSEVAKTATYTHAYAEDKGFLTLLSDGERLTGAYALGPEAGEWLQQATLAIRAHLPLDVLADTIQPFPTFSEIYVAALKKLRGDDRDDGAVGQRSRRPLRRVPHARRCNDRFRTEEGALMEYLVTMTTHVPEGTSDAAVARNASPRGGALPRSRRGGSPPSSVAPSAAAGRMAQPRPVRRGRPGRTRRGARLHAPASVAHRRGSRPLAAPE